MTIDKAQIIAGQQVYTPFLLKVYNLLVIHFSSRFVWRCPNKYVLELYNQHITNNHLDIGVGTGYFLNHVQFPHKQPKLALLDLNQHCLTYTSALLSRYHPTCYCADIFQPLDMVEDKFKSISLNYVLHCLPGSMEKKAVVISNIAKLLDKDGVFFGSTILGQGTRQNFLAKYLMKVYNNKKIFSNYQDNLQALESILNKYFTDVQIKVIGMVVLFVAKI